MQIFNIEAVKTLFPVTKYKIFFAHDEKFQNITITNKLTHPRFQTKISTKLKFNTLFPNIHNQTIPN